jgi:hypothetical protein
MTGPDTRDAESLAGAVYFIVGRGTEGGPASYRLSIAGLIDQSAVTRTPTTCHSRAI